MNAKQLPLGGSDAAICRHDSRCNAAQKSGMVNCPNYCRYEGKTSTTRRYPPVHPMMKASSLYPVKCKVPARPIKEAADIQSAPAAMPSKGAGTRRPHIVFSCSCAAAPEANAGTQQTNRQQKNRPNPQTRQTHALSNAQCAGKQHQAQREKAVKRVSWDLICRLARRTPSRIPKKPAMVRQHSQLVRCIANPVDSHIRRRTR